MSRWRSNWYCFAISFSIMSGCHVILMRIACSNTPIYELLVGESRAQSFPSNFSLDFLHHDTFLFGKKRINMYFFFTSWCVCLDQNLIVSCLKWDSTSFFEHFALDFLHFDKFFCWRETYQHVKFYFIFFTNVMFTVDDSHKQAFLHVNMLYESSRREPGWRFTAGFECVPVGRQILIFEKSNR